jgi:hypothetical protein
MLSKNLMHNLASVTLACIVGYFMYHTVQGDHGWLTMVRLKGEVSAAQSTLSQLQKTHQVLEHRVDMLRSSHIDPDLLDEESRSMLNYSKPNDVIILSPPKAQR